MNTLFQEFDVFEFNSDVRIMNGCSEIAISGQATSGGLQVAMHHNFHFSSYYYYYYYYNYYYYIQRDQMHFCGGGIHFDGVASLGSLLYIYL